MNNQKKTSLSESVHLPEVKPSGLQGASRQPELHCVNEEDAVGVKREFFPKLPPWQ